MREKWTLFWFWTGDFKAVERYLNQQAAKGWELEKARIVARWKKTDRRDLSYCVDLANPKDKNRPYLRESYLQFCAECGWDLVCLVNEMFIFRSEAGKKAVPIQTDPELELEHYKACFFKRTIWNLVLSFCAMAISGINLIRFGWTGALRWMVGILLALGIVVMVWRVAGLIRAIVGIKKREIAVSPPWVMWTNCAMIFALAGVVALGLAIIVMLF